MSDIVEQVRYPEPIDVVWAALTSRELVSEWLMPTRDYATVVGHRFSFHAPRMPGWDGVIHCEVLEVLAPTRLAWSWRGSNMRAATRVTFTLEPDAAGTVLTLEHTGWAGLGGFVLSRTVKLKRLESPTLATCKDRSAINKCIDRRAPASRPGSIRLPAGALADTKTNP